MRFVSEIVRFMLKICQYEIVVADPFDMTSRQLSAFMFESYYSKGHESL
jgi:hypothetical protein